MKRYFLFLVLLLLCAASYTGLPIAPTNAVMKEYPSWQYFSVLRLGVNSIGDAPAEWFIPSKTPCSISGGDIGSQVPTNDGGCFNAAPASEGYDPREWGAPPGGVVDAAAQLTKMFSSGLSPISWPGLIFRSSTGQTAPDNTVIKGTTFNAAYPPTGSVLQCDLSVINCLTIGNGDNKPNIVSGLTISRAAGTPPVNSLCILVNKGDNVTIEDVQCYGHAIGLYVLNTGVDGVYLHVNRLYTCGITDSDVVISGWPGAYFTQSNFGCDGAADVVHNQYVKVIGNWDATLGTIHFNDVHMNLGSNTVKCAVNFENFTGSSNILWDFEIIGGHIETDQNAFCSDSTVKGLTLLQLQGVWIGGGWGGGNHFFANDSSSPALQAGLNPAATINSWAINGLSLTAWNDLTLAPTAQINDLKINGSSLIIPISITGVSDSGVTLVGNTYNGITLGGNFAAALVQGISVGSVTNSATGSIKFDLPGLNQIFALCPTLGLEFGGASTGITYQAGTPVCQYKLQGNLITVTFQINLTSKGSATGAASIVGLPIAAQNALQGVSPLYNENMSSLSSDVLAEAGGNSSTIYLYLQGATGLNTLTDTNFTNSSIIGGSVTYLTAGLP